MYKWAEDLFPICRSITGQGVRETLSYIQKLLPDLEIHEVKSGTKAFDWEVPDEWNIKDAFVMDENGKKVIDFKKHNLHVVGYSDPIDRKISLDELQNHLYSLPNQPDAIPYITSYYKRRWGFCISDNERKKLNPGTYHIKIDSSLKSGHLTYAQLILPGSSEEEILLSTYICHPSMANNEISGPVVTTALVRWLQTLKHRRYTYRIVFVPETIGSIVYISQNANEMKKNIKAGFVITCIGDTRTYSYLQSRLGNTLADQTAKNVLRHHVKDYKEYSFLERGSDERQYCSPGVDLPVISIMRSKYGTYPEYHTSLDDMSFISPEGLQGGYDVLQKCIEVLENNFTYKTNVNCEPQLAKHGLYPTISKKDSKKKVQEILSLIAYADGNHTLLEIADKIGVFAGDLVPIVKKILEANLFDKVKDI